ncbi:MAG: hypothetical protein IJ323_03825 [Clostridia bacterium]|nr:hypothetical protein [Clostridia bacterium]
MSKKIISKPGLFGVTYHYDECGNYLGKSRPGLFGDTQVHYDANNNHTATTRPGFFAKKVTTDVRTGKRISTRPSYLGDVHSSNGKRIGKSRPGFFGKTYTTFEEDE